LARELRDEARAVVVAAAHAVDARAVDRRRLDLLRLEPGRAEDDGGHAERRRTRGDRAREVARRGTRERVEPELLRLRRRDGDDAVLERVRRVREVELEEDLADAERRGEPWGGHERREARARVHSLRRLGGEERRVAPERCRAGLDRRARDRARELVPVVDRLERAEAAAADAVRERRVL